MFADIFLLMTSHFQLFFGEGIELDFIGHG